MAVDCPSRFAILDAFFQVLLLTLPSNHCHHGGHHHEHLDRPSALDAAVCCIRRLLYPAYCVGHCATYLGLAVGPVSTNLHFYSSNWLICKQRSPTDPEGRTLIVGASIAGYYSISAWSQVLLWPASQAPHCEKISRLVPVIHLTNLVRQLRLAVCDRSLRPGRDTLCHSAHHRRALPCVSLLLGCRSGSLRTNTSFTVPSERWMPRSPLLLLRTPRMLKAWTQ